MKTTVLLILSIFAQLGLSAAAELPKILVFSKTSGFRHNSIEAGVEAIQVLGKQHGFHVEHSEDADLFTDEKLQGFQAIVFLSTTGDILNTEQKAAFQQFIQAGKGFVGIHAASDTEHHWPWYGGLVGGYFASHPEVQSADISVVDREHPSTAHLPTIWHRKDEWYDFQHLNPKVRVLMTLDERSYQGGSMGEHHPVCWYHRYDGGRAFYTALGHTKEAYQEPDFLQHILGGIFYAIGKTAPH